MRTRAYFVTYLYRIAFSFCVITVDFCYKLNHFRTLPAVVKQHYMHYMYHRQCVSRVFAHPEPTEIVYYFPFSFILWIWLAIIKIIV